MLGNLFKFKPKVEHLDPDLEYSVIETLRSMSELQGAIIQKLLELEKRIEEMENYDNS